MKKKNKKNIKHQYKFWKWLINQAIAHNKVYWLMWGVIIVLGICAWKFGLSWLI